MNETIALTLYVWTRYRIFFLILIPVLLLSAIATPLASVTDAPQWFSGTVVGGGYLAVLIALIGSIVLFGFSRQVGLHDPKSNYDDWLMRLPISSWKLAIIPAGLMTCWIMTIWTGTVIVIRLLGGPPIPIVTQSLGMSACAIVASSLVWMPFRVGGLRIVLMIVSLPLLYFVGLGAIAVSIAIAVSVESPTWTPWALAGIVTSYLASLVFAIYSVKFARVSSFQQSNLASVDSARKPAVVFSSRTFARWPEALKWYDGRRSQVSKVRQVLAMSPVVAILICVLPLAPATAIFTLVFVSATVGGVALARLEPTVWGARSSLPSYLIASPLPSRTMAFVRLRAYATAYVGMMFVMTLLCLSCFVWQSNREAAARWWSSFATTGVAPLTPMRMIAAIYLAILVTMLGSFLRLVCVQMRGRQMIVVWMMIACCVAIMSPLIGFLTWFIQQRDWAHVTSVAEDWLKWSYQLFYIALTVKLTFDANVAWSASKSIFSRREIFKMIVGWCVLVVTCAIAWHALWPLGNVQFATVLMATSLALPLSVCFTGPLAVRANRHHRVTG